MKKILFKIACVALCVCSFGLVSCKKDEIEEANLYEKGIDTILVMEEMMKSEEYAELFGLSDYDLTDVLAEDYRDPTNVYSISVPSNAKILQVLQTSGAIDGELWGTLSESLKEQAEFRVGFNTLIMRVNAMYGGSEKMAIASVYTAHLTFNDSLDETIAYLYVYETGVAVMVTFTPTASAFTASTQLFFADDCASIETVKEFFTPFGCAVESVR